MRSTKETQKCVHFGGSLSHPSPDQADFIFVETSIQKGVRNTFYFSGTGGRFPALYNWPDLSRTQQNVLPSPAQSRDKNLPLHPALGICPDKGSAWVRRSLPLSWFTLAGFPGWFRHLRQAWEFSLGLAYGIPCLQGITENIPRAPWLLLGGTTGIPRIPAFPCCPCAGYPRVSLQPEHTWITWGAGLYVKIQR